ncbi:TetR/AcrR family transcriptional regulator [Nonomuraea sp. NPDC050328]|uniref:TetR/AcrR family transcriptional regulator n=1 Tax=Nonomuraea sp. NPDC050328 TaxID=3364361 RepID=UPI00379B498A
MTEQPRRGRSDKRQAILAGALAVFARDGYTRASIDAISAEAGVSTRTVYNHFADKAELFLSVIHDSAARAAEAQIAIIDRHLRKVTDLEADLIAFGLDWTAPMPDLAAHFALVKQVGAEEGHIPPEAIETWRRTGPQRVRAELAARLRHLAERGAIRAEDPERAALHLMLLVSADLPERDPHAPQPERSAATVAAGVRTFLHGHQAPS